MISARTALIRASPRSLLARGYAKIASAPDLAPPKEPITAPRPTNALGFAERMASRAGGFQFEQFYQGEIDKKLKDNSTCRSDRRR